MTSDGVLHVLGLASGKDLQKPALFLPPNARWSDPIAVGETMYAATSQNCGGAPNGIWAVDLAGENKPVTSWTTLGGGIVGSLAFATDGSLIAAIGAGPVTPGGYANAIVALDPKTLHVKDWFTSPTVELASAPLIFKNGDKDIVAVATQDGRVLLLDTASLGGSDHKTPLYASRAFTATPATFAPEAMAMWQDTGGTQWLLLPVTGPTSGTIVALKVVDNNGAPTLEQGWVSRDLISPMTPLIVNGVVFAVSRGKPATAAVLYAMNGVDGTELWNSGKAITSYQPGRSFWSANGQVYVGTFDGTVYAFGFAMERK